MLMLVRVLLWVILGILAVLLRMGLVLRMRRFSVTAVSPRVVVCCST